MLAGMTLRTGRKRRRSRDEVDVEFEVSRQSLCWKRAGRHSLHTVRLFPLRWTRRGRASRWRPPRRPGEGVCHGVIGALAKAAMRVIRPSQLSTVTLQQGMCATTLPRASAASQSVAVGRAGWTCWRSQVFSALSPDRFSRSSPAPHNSCVWTSGRGSFAWAGCPWP